MLQKYILGLWLLSLSPLGYAYEFNQEPVNTCWSEGDIVDFKSFDEPGEPAFFTGDQCNGADTFTHERNFFAAYAAPEMEKINQIMQDQLEPLWLDNQGHSQAAISSGVQAMRTYNHCLRSLCDLIARDCGGANQVGDWEKNFERCGQRADKMIGLTQTQLDSALTGNTTRKSRSLVVESVSRIGHHFDTWLHPRLSQFNRIADVSQNAILSLTKYTW